MKKIIISLLIIIGIILTGWLLKDVTISNNYAENGRFIQIYTQYSKNGYGFLSLGSAHAVMAWELAKKEGIV